MGQKVDPRCFRTGPALYNRWDSMLYADRDYAEKIAQDLKIKNLIHSKHASARISRILLDRTSNSLTVCICVKKPGVIIGKAGADIEKLKNDIAMIVNCDVSINIKEIKQPSLDASIVAQDMAQQIENRGSYRRSMKMAMQNAMKHGAKGIKVSCAGRLSGAEIAREEKYKDATVPLHTLRADVDYATAEAVTTYGVIGIKVWIYKGDFSSATKIKAV